MGCLDCRLLGFELAVLSFVLDGFCDQFLHSLTQYSRVPSLTRSHSLAKPTSTKSISWTMIWPAGTIIVGRDHSLLRPRRELSGFKG